MTISVRTAKTVSLADFLDIAARTAENISTPSSPPTKFDKITIGIVLDPVESSLTPNIIPFGLSKVDLDNIATGRALEEGSVKHISTLLSKNVPLYLRFLESLGDSPAATLEALFVLNDDQRRTLNALDVDELHAVKDMVRLAVGVMKALEPGISPAVELGISIPPPPTAEAKPKLSGGLSLGGSCTASSATGGSCTAGFSINVSF